MSNSCFIGQIYTNIQPQVGIDPDLVTINSNGRLGRANEGAHELPLHRRGDGFHVQAVGQALDVPAVGFKAQAAVFGEGKTGRAFDRDVVVVVQVDQLAEAEVTGELTSGESNRSTGFSLRFAQWRKLTTNRNCPKPNSA